jgi:hypothetical protein
LTQILFHDGSRRAETVLVPIKFGFGQQEYPVPAQRKLQPGEFDRRKTTFQRRLTIAYLDDKNTVIGKKPRCIMQDRYD